MPVEVQIKYTGFEGKRRIEHVYTVGLGRRNVDKCFKHDDFDILFVCLQTRGSDKIDYIYCIPMSAAIDARIVSCDELNIKGKQVFYLAPYLDANDESAAKYCKYYYLNKYKICVRDLDHSQAEQEKLKRWIKLAAIAKVAKQT